MVSKLHPTDIIYPEPIRVSSLIRAARWSALGLGIVWGYFRYYQIARRHADIREWEAQKFIHHKEEEEVYAKLKARAETEFVLQVTGAPIEEGKAGMDSEHLYLYDKA